MKYKKIKATQTVGDIFIKGTIYSVLSSDGNSFHFINSCGSDCKIGKDVCNGQYAIFVTEELNKNIKVL